MPLDSDSLGSLRIDRSAPASGGGSGKRLIYIGLTVVLVAAAGFGLWKWLGGKTTEVTTVVAEADSTGPSLGNSVLNASGYVVARRMATVSSKVTGKIEEILVEEGMTVKKGQVLAKLDPVNLRTILTMSQRELEASRRNLAEIEVRLADARRTLERNESLVKQQLVSQSALDTSRAEVNALAARLEASRAQVKVAESRLDMRRDRLRRPAGARAVRRRHHLQGRAAGRNRLADVGGRWLHAHRHRDHRRHGLARSRSRCQRSLYQPRQTQSARRGHSRCLSGSDSARPRDQHRAHRGSHQGHRARAHRLR